jgi:hypothetical protein
MNVMSKIAGFTITYAQWAAAGFPRREPEWVAELFAICEPCELFDPEAKGPFGDLGICKECGCHVGPDAENLRNKLVVPQTSCPLEKWGASVDKKPYKPTGILSRMFRQRDEWRAKNR